MQTTEPMASGTAGAAPTPDLIRGAAPSQTVRTETYELVVIIPATYPDEEIPAIKEKIAAAITEHGVKVTNQQDLEKRRLAFPIKHIRQGFYQAYQFEGSVSHLAKLDHDLRLMPEVLRHLITVRTVKTEEQLAEEAALRERIKAKRAAADEREVAKRHATEAAAAPKQPEAPTREVSKEELEKKIEQILTDDTLGE